MEYTTKQIDALVKAAQQGNKKAFAELYEHYFDQIHKYVFYKVSSEHVDDLVSTIFVKTWTKLNKYQKQKHPFTSWLYRIAHNTVVDHYRTNKDHYELEERIADDNDRLNPEQVLEQKLTGERVQRALRKVNDRYREILLLKFMNDMSNREIADALSINESNVRTLQFRALKKLKGVIEKQEAEAEKTLRQREQDAPQKGLISRLFARES